MLMSSASGLTFWGIVATLGPLAAAGSIIGVLPHSYKVLVLLIGPLFVPFGNFTMGILTDRIGRKKIFLITMIMYGIGIVIISLSYTFIPLIIGLMLAEFGVGGEEIPSLSLVSEDSPISQRAKWLTIISDFDNIGSAIIAGLFLVLVTSFADRVVLLLAASFLIIVMIFSRLSLPESFKWENIHGKFENSIKTRSSLYIDSAGETVKKPSYRLTLSVLMAMAISQYTTFGLMAYIIGPYEFPGVFTDDMIIFVALLGASVAGFIAAPLITRGRKKYTLYSYGLGFISTVAIFLVIPLLNNVLIFYPLLFFNMMMSEFAWASRTTLEPELSPTRIRGIFMGTVRLAPMIVYPLLVYLTSNVSIRVFIIINVGLWLLGFIAAIVWHHYGIETAKVNIDYPEA
ncbi:MFS transporter [Ferroplasma acidiphilum]|uniref:MFS transporter n=1 Tax=Ferroplasma acidiphilum TaxID=74969 RepID=UPI002816398A|nr:MFS transporter [Ferroplasma acidiphilum]WMT53648.1 MAG: MFS transporter [Ferroplasma acidiphilum]